MFRVFVFFNCVLIALHFAGCTGFAEKRSLPMPPDGKELHDHMESRDVCTTDGNDGLGSLCEVAFELVIKGFEGNEHFKWSMVNGWYYIGKPIAGWNWDQKKQEWVQHE